MLYLIGLGLAWKDLSLKALEAINKSDKIYLECYTSISDFSVLKLERLLGKKIQVLSRKEVEETQPFFKEAHLKDIALLVYGDPLTATTHTELILSAKKKKIKIEVIHAPSIFTAVAQSGLFLYKFGKTASIPIPEKGFRPESFFDILEQNQRAGAHTLFLLDLKPEEKKYLTIRDAIKILLQISKKRKSKFLNEGTLCVGCARLGQKAQIIKVAEAKQLMNASFGSPPYCLIVPSKLHFMEEEVLKKLK